jgi:hypothetical protein
MATAPKRIKKITNVRFIEENPEATLEQIENAQIEIKVYEGFDNDSIHEIEVPSNNKKFAHHSDIGKSNKFIIGNFDKGSVELRLTKTLKNTGIFLKWDGLKAELSTFGEDLIVQGKKGNLILGNLLSDVKINSRKLILNIKSLNLLGNLEVSGFSTLKDKLLVGKETVLNDTLLVENDATFNQMVTIQDSLNVAETTKTKKLIVENTANISGDLSVSGDLELSGDTTINNFRIDFEDLQTNTTNKINVSLKIQRYFDISTISWKRRIIFEDENANIYIINQN